MLEQIKNSYYLTGFFLVFFAGLLWSFGVVVVRYMIDGHQYVFQYLFCRGISIAVILICYLFYKEGFALYKNFSKIGIPGLIGGMSLGTAMIGFIFSITMTTAAVTLFMLAVMPFIAAIIGYIFLKESLRKLTFISMMFAFVGVSFIIYNDSLEGSVLGAFIGFIVEPAFPCIPVK